MNNNPKVFKNPLHLVNDYFDLEGKICAEIGVQKGKFSNELYKCKPKELVLIDCWEKQDTKVYSDVSNKDKEKQIIYYEKVKRKFENKNNVKIIKDFSVNAVKLFEDNYFDFIYIDANHSFEACYLDLNIWWLKLKIGGCLCGHDLSRKSVKMAVETFSKKNNLFFDRLTRNSWGIKK